VTSAVLFLGALLPWTSTRLENPTSPQAPVSPQTP